MQANTFDSLYTEMKCFMTETGNYSYYDFKTYLLKTNPELADLLKNRYTARCITELMKAEKKRVGAKYKTSKFEALDKYMDVRYAVSGEGENPDDSNKPLLEEASAIKNKKDTVKQEQSGELENKKN